MGVSPGERGRPGTRSRKRAARPVRCFRPSRVPTWPRGQPPHTRSPPNSRTAVLRNLPLGAGAAYTGARAGAHVPTEAWAPSRAKPPASKVLGGAPGAGPRASRPSRQPARDGRGRSLRRGPGWGRRGTGLGWPPAPAAHVPIALALPRPGQTRPKLRPRPRGPRVPVRAPAASPRRALTTLPREPARAGPHGSLPARSCRGAPGILSEKRPRLTR